MERAQGHVSVGRGDARRRDDRHHRGRRLSGAAPRRGDARPAAAAGRSMAMPDAIIFGHALEGNLHFVFTQDFNVAAEVERYRGFMDALCQMVVERYDGSLKAEHGTGRNIAPFVELEWGAEAYALMRAIKRLFDPRGLLNPGRDHQRRSRCASSRHLKPLPACDPIVDKCIECGFCEPKCPSHRLDAVAAAAHRRVAGDRRLERDGRTPPQASRRCSALYDYHGIDTCAALRTVRHRVSGRHRDRHSDQGAARTPRRPARAARRGRRRRPLRGYDRGGARRTWPQPTRCTGSSARG